mgnify:CR=1 FL=1
MTYEKTSFVTSEGEEFGAKLDYIYSKKYNGEWKAQMDIGYDMIWSSSDSYALSEYLMDYTCTEEEQ